MIEGISLRQIFKLEVLEADFSITYFLHLFIGLMVLIFYDAPRFPEKNMKMQFHLMFKISIRVILAAFVGATALAGKEKPNIIYIMTDDLGYGDLGCYGQQRIKTPQIDQLAEEGMRFSQFYAGSTVCAPSRCVLMTGYHTGHALVRGNREIKPMGQWPLPDETLTVAEVLKKAGYTTGLIGKWGLGGPGSSGHPNRQGFDYFFGYLCQRHAHNYYPEFLFRNEARIPLKGNKVENDRLDGAGYATDRTTFSHDLCADEAMEFVKRNHENTFFLYLSLTIPHANNEGGKRGMEVPDYGMYSDMDWPEPQKGHAAMISRMDADIGKLMALLKKLEIDDHTIVFFTSDNGPHREGGNDPNFNDSNGPLRGIKRDLYEGGIRVPMIVRWPGKIAPQSVSDHIGYFGDFMTTAAALAGTRAPKGLDSVSFLDTLLGNSKNQEQHPYLYWEFHGGGRHFQAIRLGPWKGVKHRNGSFELFRLDQDLGELNDLAANHQSVVTQLSIEMERSHQDNLLWK